MIILMEITKLLSTLSPLWISINVLLVPKHLDKLKEFISNLRLGSCIC